MTEKFKLVKNEPYIENTETGECYDLDSDNFSYIVKIMNDLSNENEKLKKSKKGQELEIVRLHHLADAMSGVLRELGIYDVYNQEQINKVKEELQRND